MRIRNPALKRVTGRIFKIKVVSNLKVQAKILSLIFSSTKNKKLEKKTISACLESNILIISLQKNIHLVTAIPLREFLLLAGCRCTTFEEVPSQEQSDRVKA
jgi:hypothetical protein